MILQHYDPEKLNTVTTAICGFTALYAQNGVNLDIEPFIISWGSLQYYGTHSIMEPNLGILFFQKTATQWKTAEEKEYVQIWFHNTVKTPKTVAKKNWIL